MEEPCVVTSVRVADDGIIFQSTVEVRIRTDAAVINLVKQIADNLTNKPVDVISQLSGAVAGCCEATENPLS